MNFKVTTLAKKDFDKLDKKDFSVGYYKTPAGVLKITYNNLGLVGAIFEDKLDSKIKFLKDKEINKLVLVGTEFQIKVWKAALEIPAGKISSYGEIAKLIGYPKAYRAVANSLANNKIAYFIPCHRVLRANKDLCGYRWGLDKKEALLTAENAAK